MIISKNINDTTTTTTNDNDSHNDSGSNDNKERGEGESQWNSISFIYRPSGIGITSVWLCVCVLFNFFLQKKFKKFCLRSPLFLGLIDLDLPGQF